MLGCLHTSWDKSRSVVLSAVPTSKNIQYTTLPPSSGSPPPDVYVYVYVYVYVFRLSSTHTPLLHLAGPWACLQHTCVRACTHTQKLKSDTIMATQIVLYVDNKSY